LNGRLYFTGHIADRPALADLLANVDLFIHPNPREPFGIAPLEAMASGLPLVAPSSGGLLSYANAGNAWLGPADAETFAAAVRTIFSNPQERDRKVAEARRTAGEHSWQCATARMFLTYDELHREVTTGSAG